MTVTQWIVRLLPWGWRFWRLLRGPQEEPSQAPVTVAKDCSAGSALIDLASEILSSLAMLRVGMYANQPLNDMRERLLTSLADFSRRCAEQGWPAATIETARYALVAYIDESILASNRRDKSEWMARPLQLELFSEQTAGQKFFEYLEELRQAPQRNVEILELFYTCLRLGFKGAYSLRGEDQLKVLEKELYSEIEALRGAPPDNLSVQLSKTSAASIPTLNVPYWAIAALTITVLTGSYLYYQGRADQRVTQVAEIELTQQGFS